MLTLLKITDMPSFTGPIERTTGTALFGASFMVYRRFPGWSAQSAVASAHHSLP